MKILRLSRISKYCIGAVLWTALQAIGVQAATVSFTSLVDPDPDLELPAYYTYEHNLISEGFNPATDTLTSAEIHVYFSEVPGVFGGNGTDDSVTLVFDGDFSHYVISDEPNDGFGVSEWDSVFSIDVDLLQSDGILLVELDGGATIFEMSELTVQGTSVVPIPAAAWFFGSAILGLIAVGRRKAAAQASA